ncbi:hypothetical protein Tco_1327565 [Tanacetum coccineum]
MNSIEQCIVEIARHEERAYDYVETVSERHVAEFNSARFKRFSLSSVTSSGDETSSGIVLDEEIDKKELEAHYGFMAKIQEALPAESSSTNTPLEHVQNNDENNVFANERQHYEKHAAECADERVALANLIANLTLDTEENKMILKQLKKANASTQELKKCKTNLDETNSTLGEAISCRDRLLALKDIEIKEGLKTKAYEISVLNQKHDELVKKSLLTRSQLEGYLKENTKVISDLKVKEEKDIDKMIEMDKQLKFLNEIVYTRNQSIQNIHMLAPKCATYNGRATFANPKYLKIAQSEKPCLYEIPYDTFDLANRFAPNREETMTLANKSRSKLNKDYYAFPNPTAKSMEVLIKTLLMPLSDKTILDSHCFVYELKTEMHDNLEYAKSLEKEIDELEYEKADFSNIYDLLLEESSKQTESVNKEVHNNLLKSFSKLEKHSISLELALQQCKEQMKNNSVCKENGSNVFRKEREQYHEIQDLKAQMQDKNIAISELKKLIEKCKGKSVELVDKPSVVRQPNAQRIPKPSVLGKRAPFLNSPEMRSFQTNQSVNKTNASDSLFKPVTLHNLPQNRKQAKIHSNMLKPGMHRIDSSIKQNREPQLPHAFRNTNPYVSTSKGVNHSTSVSRPQLKSYQVKDKVVPNNSQVKFTKKEVEDHHRISSISKTTKSVTAYNDSSNSRTSNVNAVCAECGKCVFNSNHDAYVSRYLNDVNARTKTPNVVPISASKPKRKTNKYVATPHKKTVASDTTTQKPKSYFKELYENTNQAWKWWIAKKCPSGYKWTRTTPPRPRLKWKPTSRIFSNVRQRWIPIGKLFNSCMGKVDSEPTHGSNIDIPHIYACKQTLDLSAGTYFKWSKAKKELPKDDALYMKSRKISECVQTSYLNDKKWRLLKITLQAPFLNVQMTSVHIISGLVLHQMTSDHNRSELRIHDHSKEQSSSKLVLKVVPLAVKTATSRQELEFLFHLSL